MSYESPIKTYLSEIETEFSDAVFRAVLRVGIDVDKEELIKALKYDRKQYEQGYHDGIMFHLPIVTNADRIRAMTDEELAEFLGKTKAFGYNHADLSEYFTAEFAKWLKKEVTTNSTT